MGRKGIYRKQDRRKGIGRRALSLSLGLSLAGAQMVFAAPADDLDEILARQAEQVSESALARYLGTGELSRRAAEKGFSFQAELGLLEDMASLEDIPAEIAEDGYVTVCFQEDKALRQWLLGVGAGMAQESMLDISVYGDEEKLALGIPQFFDGTVGIRSGSLREQYAGSALEELMEEELPEGFDLNLTFFPETCLGETAEGWFAEEWDTVQDTRRVEAREQGEGQIYTASYETEALIQMYRRFFEDFFDAFLSAGLVTDGDVSSALDELNAGLDEIQLVMDEEFSVDYFVVEGNVASLECFLEMDMNRLSGTEGDTRDAGAAANVGDTLVDLSLEGEDSPSGTAAGGGDTLVDLSLEGEDSPSGTAADGGDTLVDISLEGEDSPSGTAGDGGDTLVDISFEGEDSPADAVAGEDSEASAGNVPVPDTESQYDPSDRAMVSISLAFTDPADWAQGWQLQMTVWDGNWEEQAWMALGMDRETAGTVSRASITLSVESEGQKVYDGELCQSSFDSGTGVLVFGINALDEDFEEGLYLSAKGSFTEAEPGQSFTFLLEECTLSDVEESFGIQGKIQYAADPGAIEKPQDTRMVCELNTGSLMGLLVEIQTNAEEWERKYGQAEETEAEASDPDGKAEDTEAEANDPDGQPGTRN